jgi:AcrR family transcriptional regulator
VTEPYERSGRTEQKARTRAALVEATRRLLAAGASPTVDEVAAAAGISRTTAFRYFPNQRALLLAAHPEIQQRSLLPDDAPRDPARRLDLVLDEFLRITVEWEPQLRASLRLSLEPGAGLPTLRQGRAIGWIEEALSPLRAELAEAEVHRLALAIRSATGIEALVWLVDVAGLSRSEATRLMRWSAHALLQAALTDDGPRPANSRRPGRRRTHAG